MQATYVIKDSFSVDPSSESGEVISTNAAFKGAKFSKAKRHKWAYDRYSEDFYTPAGIACSEARDDDNPETFDFMLVARSATLGDNGFVDIKVGTGDSTKTEVSISYTYAGGDARQFIKLYREEEGGSWTELTDKLEVPKGTWSGKLRIEGLQQTQLPRAQEPGFRYRRPYDQLAAVVVISFSCEDDNSQEVTLGQLGVAVIEPRNYGVHIIKADESVAELAAAQARANEVFSPVATQFTFTEAGPTQLADHLRSLTSEVKQALRFYSYFKANDALDAPPGGISIEEYRARVNFIKDVLEEENASLSAQDLEEAVSSPTGLQLEKAEDKFPINSALNVFIVDAIGFFWRRMANAHDAQIVVIAVNDVSIKTPKRHDTDGDERGFCMSSIFRALQDTLLNRESELGLGLGTPSIFVGSYFPTDDRSISKTISRKLGDALAHECGHALGLEHLADMQSIMLPKMETKYYEAQQIRTSPDSGGARETTNVADRPLFRWRSLKAERGCQSHWGCLISGR